MTLLTQEQEDIQIINNVLKKIDVEREKLHERFMKVPAGKYDDRWNKIRWRINEVNMERRALEELKARLLQKICEHKYTVFNDGHVRCIKCRHDGGPSSHFSTSDDSIDLL